MKKRMNFYLDYYEQLTKNPRTNDAAGEKEQLLIQIQFFQHERLIHLIVTALFAVLTVLSIFATLQMPEMPALILLDVLFLVLLVPYIRHYYLLENGVQKLYEYYDKLCDSDHTRGQD